MKYKLSTGKYTKNPIESWLDKTPAEIEILRGAGLLPPYAEEAIKSASQAAKTEKADQSPAKPVRKKRVAKKAPANPAEESSE